MTPLLMTIQYHGFTSGTFISEHKKIQKRWVFCIENGLWSCCSGAVFSSQTSTLSQTLGMGVSESECAFNPCLVLFVCMLASSWALHVANVVLYSFYNVLWPKLCFSYLISFWIKLHMSSSRTLLLCLGISLLTLRVWHTGSVSWRQGLCCSSSYST